MCHGLFVHLDKVFVTKCPHLLATSKLNWLPISPYSTIPLVCWILGYWRGVFSPQSSSGIGLHRPRVKRIAQMTDLERQNCDVYAHTLETSSFRHSLSSEVSPSNASTTDCLLASKSILFCWTRLWYSFASPWSAFVSKFGSALMNKKERAHRKRLRKLLWGVVKKKDQKCENRDFL